MAVCLSPQPSPTRLWVPWPDPRKMLEMDVTAAEWRFVLSACHSNPIICDLRQSVHLKTSDVFYCTHPCWGRPCQHRGFVHFNKSDLGVWGGHTAGFREHGLPTCRGKGRRAAGTILALPRGANDSDPVKMLPVHAEERIYLLNKVGKHFLPVSTVDQGIKREVSEPALLK